MRAKEFLDKPTGTVESIAEKHGVSVDVIKAQLKKGIPVELEHTSNHAMAKEIALDHLGEQPDYYDKLEKVEVSEDWNKVNHHDKTNGLSQKAVNAYRREHPGSKLKTAVTTKPSKLKAGSKDAKRRKSFCARMSGNKGPMKKPNGKPTPKALALRRWNCESINEGEGDPAGVNHISKELITHIIQQVGTEGAHAIVKSLQWGDGAAKELLQLIVNDLKQDISMAESVKQRLDPQCWKNKHKEGTKIKGGVRVNNCMPNKAKK
jgi:hypothetical protein